MVAAEGHRMCVHAPVAVRGQLCGENLFCYLLVGLGIELWLSSLPAKGFDPLSHLAAPLSPCVITVIYGEVATSG